MADEANEELDSQDQDVTDTETTDEVEETDVEPGTEDEGKPQYTEREMKSFARAKKAEADAKRLKAEKAELLRKLEQKEKAKEKTTNNQDQKPKEAASVEETILRATKGYDDEAIEELTFIAERQGISLLAAEHDRRFQSYLKLAEEDRRKAEASLGASKGSGRKAAEPDLTQPGLTPEQHRKLAEEKYGIR